MTRTENWDLIGVCVLVEVWTLVGAWAWVLVGFWGCCFLPDLRYVCTPTFFSLYHLCYTVLLFELLFLYTPSILICSNKEAKGFFRVEKVFCLMRYYLWTQFVWFELSAAMMCKQNKKKYWWFYVLQLYGPTSRSMSAHCCDLGLGLCGSVLQQDRVLTARPYLMSAMCAAASVCILLASCSSRLSVSRLFEHTAWLQGLVVFLRASMEPFRSCVLLKGLFVSV